MTKELFDSLRLISSFIVIIPLVLCALKLKSLNKAQINLLYLLITVFIVEFISNLLWYKKLNNLPLYHLYAVIEFLLIINIYKEKLSGLFSRSFFLILGVAFMGFAVINTLFFQNIYTFNSNVTTPLGFLVIFFALSYFYKLLKEVKYSALEVNPMFWISSGFLIYFSSNLILFFINNTLFDGVSEASRMVWGLHAIVNIVLIIFYTIAIWVNPQKKQLH